MNKKVYVSPGYRNNKLKAIEYLYTGKHYRRMFKWLCECGNTIDLSVEAVTSGNTKSCGCLVKEAAQRRKLPNNGGTINQIILGYKRHATSRNLRWNLTFDDVKKLISQPCNYCGVTQSNTKITKNCKEGFKYNGIDRVDNSIGYEPCNTVSCCKICNRAKLDLPHKEFIEWVKRVAEQWS